MRKGVLLQQKWMVVGMHAVLSFTMTVGKQTIIIMDLSLLGLDQVCQIW